jgi:hypothetical protein
LKHEIAILESSPTNEPETTTLQTSVNSEASLTELFSRFSTTEIPSMSNVSVIVEHPIVNNTNFQVVFKTFLFKIIKTLADPFNEDPDKNPSFACEQIPFLFWDDFPACLVNAAIVILWVISLMFLCCIGLFIYICIFCCFFCEAECCCCRSQKSPQRENGRRETRSPEEMELNPRMENASLIDMSEV